MTPEKNKIKCREYYQRTKNILSEETKTKRREQAKLRSRTFYLRNRELCIKRSTESRAKNKVVYDFPKVNIKQDLITLNQIKFVKSFDLFLVIKKQPRLRIWDKKISDWNINDFNKFKNLIQ